jgi:hypothetical protein
VPRRTLVLVVALLAFAVGYSPAQAADAVRMSVRPGLDGMVKLGHWIPVEVQISNAGTDISGRIEIQVDGIDNRGAFNRPAVVYSAPAVLPRQSSKRFVLEVFLPNPVEKITAKLVAGSETLTQAEASVERLSQTEMLCGVLSGNRGALDFLPSIDLAGRQRHLRIAHLDAADLPRSPHLLSTLDCLILANASLTGMSDLQKSALHSWTATGGLLVVAGGPGWQKTVGGMPPGLLPVTVTGTVPLRSARSLEAYFGESIEDPGPWLVAESTVTDGVVIVAEGNLPLVVAARRGQGAVVFLALDPALEPLRNWRGSAPLWRHIASYAPAPLQMPSNFIRQYAGWGRPPRGAMADLTPLRPSTAETVPFTLLLFALAVGPGAYIVLRRLGRLDWVLWVAPMLTAIATVGAFGAARSNSESDVLFNKVSLVHSWDANAAALSRTYVSVFSPREGVYEIDADGREGQMDGLILPIFNPFPTVAATGSPTPNQGRLMVDRASNTYLPGYALDARSLGTFIVDGRAPRGGGVQSALTLSAGSLYGTITNGSNRLSNAALVIGQDVHRLGDLAPGETRPIAVPIGEVAAIGYVDMALVARQLYPSQAQSTPVPVAEAMSRDIIDGALSSNFSFASRVELAPVSLVGWNERSPLSLKVRNARAAEIERTLLVAALPVDPQSGEDQRVPPALMERRNLIAGSGRLSGATMSLSAGESLLFEYVLPHRPDRFALDQVGVDINNTALGNGPLADISQLSFYDWHLGDWRDIPVSRGIVPLGDPARAVSALGQVRLRLIYRPPIGPNQSANLMLDRFDLVARGRGV